MTAASITDEVRLDAIRALYGVRLIIHREMFKPEAYISETPKVFSSGSLSLCNGHTMCAVGSLWIGGGVKPQFVGGVMTLPSAFPGSRLEIIQRMPGLALAYETMNEVCEKFCIKNDLALDDVCYEGAMEVLFELHGADEKTMLKLIGQAVKKIEKG